METINLNYSANLNITHHLKIDNVILNSLIKNFGFILSNHKELANQLCWQFEPGIKQFKRESIWRAKFAHLSILMLSKLIQRQISKKKKNEDKYANGWEIKLIKENSNVRIKRKHFKIWIRDNKLWPSIQYVFTKFHLPYTSKYQTKSSTLAD